MAAKIEEKQEGRVRLMFQDEAGFGRINKPKYCWCIKGFRPHVPCHHIRASHKEKEDYINYHLSKKENREIVPYKAPAEGLYLVDVNY